VAEPFIAEIRIVGFDFAPRGYASCDGQLLSINQNQSLFSLLGFTYGGDGRTTFGLPDLQCRVPIHNGDPVGPDPDRRIGEKAGEEGHSLTGSELPEHNHKFQASGDQATLGTPADNALAGRSFGNGSFYSTEGPFNEMKDGIIGNNSLAGNAEAHDNMQPFAVVNYVIALIGTFPSRN
jgi:microcystin-dependent protein